MPKFRTGGPVIDRDPKDIEEALLKNLQKLQRQPNSTSANNTHAATVPKGSQATSSIPSSSFYLRHPPDEAASADGKGLAMAFSSLASRQGVIPKSIQEKTLVQLAARSVNPAVCQAFFDVLLNQCQQVVEERGQQHSNTEMDDPTLVIMLQMDGWLPSWILYTEKRLEEDGHGTWEEDDVDANSFEPLTCMIRAYARFVQLKCMDDRAARRHETNKKAAYDDDDDDDDNINKTAGGGRRTTTASASLVLRHSSTTMSGSFVGTIAKCYSKLQTQAARMAMLREFTSVAFEFPETQDYRLVLTPLMTCSVLSNSTTMSSSSSSLLGEAPSMAEAVLCMEGIWREAFGLVFDSVADQCDDLEENEEIEQKERPIDDHDDKRILDLSSTTLPSSSSQPITTVLDVILWLTDTLNLYLLSISTRKSRSSRIACKVLAHRWLAAVLEMGAIVVQQVSPVSPATTPVAPVSAAAADADVETEAAVQTATTTTTTISFHCDDATAKRMETWFQGILSTTLPRWFALVPSYRICMEDFWLSIAGLMEAFSSDFPLVTIVRLATIALTHTTKEDVREILTLLAKSIDGVSVGTDSTMNKVEVHPTAFAMLRGLGSIFLRDEVCASTTKILLQTLSRTKRTKVQHNVSSGDVATSSRVKNASAACGTTLVSNIVEFSETDTTTFECIVRFGSLQNNSPDEVHSFSAALQSSVLLYGIGLLDSSNHRGVAFAFLKNVLLVYPHLGVTLLPVMVDSINAAAIRGEGEYMMEQIRFLCDVIVKDTQCAREVWKLLGMVLMQDDIPVVIRSSIIRVFPRICIANKRLYKRVIESMGATLSECNKMEHRTQSLTQEEILELRLAIAASIADLARDDIVRDPTDVIGWIQNFTSDAGWVRPTSTLDKDRQAGAAGLVHYSILSLHYLVLAQELDYKLVVAVLSKRLCAVYDLDEISKLPPLILEPLILLLGDGEIEDDESEDEDGPRLVGVSPQASKSVETLINLWQCRPLRPGTLARNPMAKTVILNCRRNIFLSLARYSIDALGIDEDGIQAVANAAAYNDKEEKPRLPETGKRYAALLNLVEYGIASLEADTNQPERPSSPVIDLEPPGEAPSTDRNDANLSNSLATFVSKLLKTEEDALGSGLWQKRSSLRRKGPKKQYGRNPEVIQPEQFKSLPSSASVLKSYNSNKCQATSLAAILSFEGKPLNLLIALGETASDPSDPLLKSFYVQAWFNTARSILNEMVSSMSSSEFLDKALSEIQDWRVENPDAMHICISCLALLIPDVLGPYGDHSSYIKEIADDVWEYYKGHMYQDSDIGKLCFGFVGAMEISIGSTGRLLEIIKDLEKTVSSYGGGPSFGAFYSMAIICNSCAALVQDSENSGQKDEDLGLISRIVSFLVTQLSLCIIGNPPALAKLVECINVGEITPEIIDTLTTLKKKGLKVAPSKRRAAKSIFIAFALCLPTLTYVNDELLLGVYCLLEGLEWGCGKGFALPSVLHTCRQTGLFEAREIEKMYAKYAKVFEEGMEKGVAGLDDIFFAVTAIQSKSIPYSIRKFILGNTNLFDDQGRALSLVSAVVSICTIPCLGRGTRDYRESARMLEAATDEDVSGVVEALSDAINAAEWSKYPQMASILLGFMAAMSNSNDSYAKMPRQKTVDLPGDATKDLAVSPSQLPTARPGTALEIVMSSLQTYFQQMIPENPNPGMLHLLSCLSVLSLPGQLVDFVQSLIKAGDDKTKAECVKILVSQTTGRPSAVFDGQDFVNFCFTICQMPVVNLRDLLGEKEAPGIFLQSFGEMLPKFPSQSVEETAENVFRFCINQIGQKPSFTIKFLISMKALLQRAKDNKSFRLSPKSAHAIQLFLLRRVFAGIRDASWPDDEAGATQERTVVETYAKCLMEVPSSRLKEADFFKVKELDGFEGESLRIRVIMALVQFGYFATSSYAYAEVASSMAWACRQLVACDDEIFSASFLHVACTIAQASSKEPAEKKKELLISLLDNLLMVSAVASLVGLEVLAALTYQWCHGSGSDGDSSLLPVLGTSIAKWQDLPRKPLQKSFRIAVHDLPFNLGRWARREKLSGIVFNRLWRIHSKWNEQGAEEESLFHLRRALISCREAGTLGGVEDFVSLVSNMVL